MTYEHIIKDIAENTPDEDSTVKKAMQKIVLAIVKEHDLSKNEAFKIISKENYVFYSRPFVFVNLTDQRRLNMEACQGQEGTATLTKNVADLYWNRDNDPKYLSACERFNEDPHSAPEDPRDVSLFTYAALYTAGWQYTGVHKIPVATPQYVYVPNKKARPESYENYCATTLFLYKPGSNPINFLWKDYTDSESGQFRDAEEALLDFVND